jgi:cytidine deaminase
MVIEMEEKLLKLLSNSYSPYSKFRVASIVVMKDGKEFGGVNVENASYGATICAERNAMFKAISEGYKPHDFESIYIMCDTDHISSCCFICRQVIEEMFEADKKVILMSRNGDKKEYAVRDLCPVPFNSEDLK